MNIENIIIQAGGLGSRLEALTANKPKCLVSINNLPIIFIYFANFQKRDFISLLTINPMFLKNT
jgi:choline kinase